ncbi:MAG: NADH-quinone oxidoreductase subunit L [Anaerolineales bacterium]|nr:NADH-quinone oxidoreductase subunit L [Anaerolineales bacterium]
MQFSEAFIQTLTWLIPLPPLLAFALIVLVTNRSKTLSHVTAIGLMGLSWVMSWIVFYYTLSIEHFGEHVIAAAVDWLPFGSAAMGTQPLQMGVLVDPLTSVMLFFVSLTCLLIFIYSVGYSNYGKPRDDHDRPGTPPHGVEPLYSRFFAYLSLFAFGMLLLVVADNLLLMFVGWEIMGLCSYLLIGFWHARNYPDPKQITPRQAAVKAFMTTRVGDMFMLLGIAYLYSQAQTLSFREILRSDEMLTHLATTPSVVAGLMVSHVVGLLLFAGTIGKSAQFPLHVWLPDAMEGPTPVSAMIHAATMVSAGVYAMIRMFPLLSAGWRPGDPLTPPMLAMAVVGAFTALFSATIAVAQSDVKKVLAYSTISQLGFMIAALGIGGYIAAAFHLVTHAFFKALLFLGSGAVIHGVEHGHHHAEQLAHTGGHAAHAPAAPFDPQNMFNMGGLARRMPITYWTFVIGGLALSGFPFVTSGFWSKDEILADAWVHAPVVFVVLAVAALLTAFYTMRQISLTFLGEPRSAAAEHASENDSIFRPMLLALVVLAFFAITAGWVGILEDFLGLRMPFPNWFHGYVGGVLLEHPPALEFNPVPLAASLVVSLGGLLFGWWVYRGYRKGADDPLAGPLGAMYAVLRDKYYFDELYERLFVRPAVWLSETFASEWVDKGVIDGTLHLVGRGALRLGRIFRDYFDAPVVNGSGDLVGESVKRFGRSFRVIQTGRVQQYLLVGMAIVVVLGAVLLLPGLGQ